MNMAIEAMVKVLEYDLPPREKYILMLYANYSNKEGKGVYPSQETMMKLSGYKSRSTIIKVTTILKESGLIIPEGRSEYKTLEWTVNLKWKGKRKDVLKEIKKYNKKHDVHMGEHVQMGGHSNVHTGIHSEVDTGEHSDVQGCVHNPLVKPSVNPLVNPFNILLSTWKELFPDKPQPRGGNKTLQAKVKTRWKDEWFRENWKEAMIRASQSPTLHEESWFDFKYFVRSEETVDNCYNRWMSWKDGNNAKKSKQQLLEERLSEPVSERDKQVIAELREEGVL